MSAIQSVSYIKAHLAEVITAVNEDRSPYVVTQNGVSKAVIMDHESYRQTRDALLMLKLMSMSEAAVRKGKTTPQATVFSSLKKRLRARIAADAKAKKK
jgi:prevent-host-death family protein